MSGTPSIPLGVSYSTASGSSVIDFLATHYTLPGPMECALLKRGFNDSFEVRGADGQRYVLRVSGRRARCDADVASETEFLAYLEKEGVPVAAPEPTRDGKLFTLGLLPEGKRPIVLFRHAEGRSPQAGSLADARTQGKTLARIHTAADHFARRNTGRFRLDLDYLLHRPVAAVLSVKSLAVEPRDCLAALASRLSASIAAIDGLTWTRCHGDCHGGNARIAEDGRATFFDFDDGGPGYLAYDLAVYLWAQVSFQRQRYPMWHAFIDGYRSIRVITPTDLEAVLLFVAIRPFGSWVSMSITSRVG